MNPSAPPGVASGWLWGRGAWSRGWLGLGLAAVLLLSGCFSLPPPNVKGEETRFHFGDLVKTDTHLVIETHQRELMGHLRQLMIKLYQRNPRELAKTPGATVEQNLAQLFDIRDGWHFTDDRRRNGVDILRQTFDDSFAGDRVFAFVAGLGSMLMASYDNRSKFSLLDDLDPQKLYNSARNIEVAFWKLSHDRSKANGEPFLLANEWGTTPNLSYERLCGKMVGVQDLLSRIVAQKTKRSVKQALQFIASSVFLPI
ncbi:MAG: hypothetical protein HQL51_13180 [Magnetococcales bacterium]|nr:hypothetical protein [Magnetococcales bacterium]